MLSSPRRIGPALHLALARRPWIRWFAIGAAALTAGWLVLGQLQDVDAARRSWTEQRTVFVATHDHAPGDLLVTQEHRLPEAAVPTSALDESPAGSISRQRISAGEVITTADVAIGSGPAAAADDGEVVVAISDLLLIGALSRLSIGLHVAVHSEGIVLADEARIVAIEGDVVFIALDPSHAASVSAAAQTRLASLAFLR
jgi:hypothetical protein